MKKNIFITASSLGVCLLTSATSYAATITYEDIEWTPGSSYTAPVLITGLDIDGTFWDVGVHWDTSYGNTYVADAPKFLGDSAGALNATTAIQQALINDGFTGTGTSGSYLITPYSTSRGYGVWGDGTMSVGLVSFGTGLYSYSGFTTWAPSAVPVPAAVWLFGSGLIGLFGIARRKKA